MNDLSAVYRDGMNAVSAAYALGIEEGRRTGRDEQARDHHQWLLSADERLAQVSAEAGREALMDAADAWEGVDRGGLRKAAEKLYRAGGPSMPTIWLRLRAGADETTAAPPPKLLAQTDPPTTRATDQEAGV